MAEIVKYVDLFGTGAVRAIVLVDGQIPEDGEGAAAQTGARLRRLAQMQADRRAFTEAFVRSMFRTPQSEDCIRELTEASLETPTNSAVVLVANMVSYGDWRPAAGKMDVPVLFVAQPQLKSSADRCRRRYPPRGWNCSRAPGTPSSSISPTASMRASASSSRGRRPAGRRWFRSCELLDHTHEIQRLLP